MELLWDRTYGFSYLSEKTRNSNRLPPALSSKLLIKTPSVGPEGV